MKSFLIVATLWIAAAAIGAQPTEPAQDNHTPRVLIISVDGLRPDLLLRADGPTLRALLDRGSYTMWAQTTPLGWTLPSHTSMLTGRRIEHHGIYWNTDERPPHVEYAHPQAPTLFDLAHQRGLTTAMVAGKSKLGTIVRDGAADHLSLPEDSSRGDQATTDAAVAIIARSAPQVMFLHLADTDIVGHRDGWGSPPQIQTIGLADACIARVLAALEARGVLGATLVIVTADHGGFDHSHHGRDPRGLHIPWIAAGPGVRENFDLAQIEQLVVHTEDTFATACRHLGLELPEACAGRAVTEAFE